MNKQMVQGLGYDPSSPVLQTGAITRLAHPALFHIQIQLSNSNRKSSGSYLPELSHPNPANHTVNKWTAPIGCDRSSYKI